MDTSDLEHAFELSASLISHTSYHSMTHMFLNYLRNLDGVEEVASYEIFGDAIKRTGEARETHDFLIKRFPLSMKDVFRDKHFDTLKRILDAHDSGPHYLVENSGPWMVLDVSKGIKPRRIVLVKGKLSNRETCIVSGLFGVYVNQVALLDKKERDQLTLLPNQHSFYILLDQVIEHYRSNPQEIQAAESWLAVININRFKEISEKLGHHFGDEVLLHFKTLMEKVFRYSDFLFRFSNDQFIVILNQTDLQGAKLSLNRFQQRITSYKFPVEEVVANIGFTKIDPQLEPSALLYHAEKALYLSEQKGQNKISLYRCDLDTSSCGNSQSNY